MNNLLSAATLLFEATFKEDAKAKASKSVAPDGGSPSKKSNFNPSQQRGKDGQWVETNAEARKAADKLPSPKTVEKAEMKLESANSRKNREIGTIEVAGKSYFVKGNIPKETIQREESAYEVGKAMGMADLVVPTKLYSINGKDYALSPNLGKEVSPTEKISVLKENKRDASRALLYDYLTNQQDRHLGNIFVTADKRIRLIDNEESFEPNKRKDIKPEEYAHDNDLKKAFSKGLLTNKTEFKETVIPDDQIQSVFKNADKIYKTLNERKDLNASIFRKRFQNLQKVYKPGATTFGDLFGDV